MTIVAHQAPLLLLVSAVTQLLAVNLKTVQDTRHNEHYTDYKFIHKFKRECLLMSAFNKIYFNRSHNGRRP